MNRILTLFSAAILFAAMGFSQTIDLKVYPEQLKADRLPFQELTTPTSNNSRLTTCGPDTIFYSFFKAFEADTSFQLLGIGGGAPSAGQRFEVPSGNSVTVNGFQFTAVLGANDATTADVICEIYLADGMGLPTGAALGADTVQVDSTFGGGSFAVLRKAVNFNPPVTATQNFVITINNTSDSTLFVGTNNWAAPGGGAGAGEDLASIFLNGAWTPTLPLSFGAGQPPLDLDWLFEPYVTYDINTTFVADQSCLVYDSTVNFLSLGSTIVQSKFYNLRAFNTVFDTVPDETLAWDFGDGSPPVFGTTVSHAFGVGANSYTVELFSLVNGYTIGCIDSFEVSLPAGGVPTADFTSSLDSSTITVAFTNNSVGADAYQWDFGDGNTSTDATPVHTYASGGVYIVRLVATSCNGALTDTIFEEIGVASVGILDDRIEDLQIFPNPTQGQLEVSLTLDQASEVQLTVFNQIGQEVLRLPAERVQTQKYHLNLTGKESGLYLLRLSIDDQAIVKKISLN